MSAAGKVEWQVTWFPPDKPLVTKRGDERQVRYLERIHAEDNPIVECRTVTAWAIVSNAAMDVAP